MSVLRWSAIEPPRFLSDVILMPDVVAAAAVIPAADGEQHGYNSLDVTIAMALA